MDPLLTISC